MPSCWGGTTRGCSAAARCAERSASRSHMPAMGQHHGAPDSPGHPQRARTGCPLAAPRDQQGGLCRSALPPADRILAVDAAGSLPRTGVSSAESRIGCQPNTTGEGGPGTKNETCQVSRVSPSISTFHTNMPPGGQRDAVGEVQHDLAMPVPADYRSSRIGGPRYAEDDLSDRRRAWRRPGIAGRLPSRPPRRRRTNPPERAPMPRRSPGRAAAITADVPTRATAEHNRNLPGGYTESAPQGV